jgi:hypothetical protein
LTTRTNLFGGHVTASNGATIYGNLGIGTNTPAEKLHVNGNALIQSNLTVGGSITYDPYTPAYDLNQSVASGTATITRAMGQCLWIAPTGTTYITAGSFPTNGPTTFSVDLFYNDKTFGFVSSVLSNTATLTSNTWNSIIFHKGAGQSVFIGR